MEFTGEGRHVLEAARRTSLLVDEVDEAVLYLSLPAARLTALGGNLGVHSPEVQRIGADSGARIWVPPADTPALDRTVTLEGNCDAIAAGFGLIMELLVPLAVRPRRDDVSIPGSAIGPVMGKEGKTLELLKGLTRCSIELKMGKGAKVVKEEGKEGGEGKEGASASVSILGPSDGVAYARALIEKLAGGERARDAMRTATAEHRAACLFFPANAAYVTRWSVACSNPYRTPEQARSLGAAAAAEAEEKAARRAAAAAALALSSAAVAPFLAAQSGPPINPWQDRRAPPQPPVAAATDARRLEGGKGGKGGKAAPPAAPGGASPGQKAAKGQGAPPKAAAASGAGGGAEGGATPAKVSATQQQGGGKGGRGGKGGKGGPIPVPFSPIRVEGGKGTPSPHPAAPAGGKGASAKKAPKPAAPQVKQQAPKAAAAPKPAAAPPLA